MKDIELKTIKHIILSIQMALSSEMSNEELRYLINTNCFLILRYIFKFEVLDSSSKEILEKEALEVAQFIEELMNNKEDYH